MAKKTRTTADAVEILYKLFVEGKPEMEELVEQARADMAIGSQIFNLRRDAGLSQNALAERMGTTRSAISRLENADYEGHSVAMLRKIVTALGKRVHITFIDPEPEEEAAA
jgi:ribosome-binding protein aMBF1 (putative translation factor)